MLLAMPVVLFPALAEEVFERPELLGLLYSAETVGAMVATGTQRVDSRVHHHGRAIVLAAAAYGGCIALAGLTPTIWLALVLLHAGRRGRHDLGLFRGTVWNQTIPDHMRGRLAGIEMLSYSVGPLGGQVRAGLVADRGRCAARSSAAASACVAGVRVTAVALRDFWSYDARTDEHAVAERDRASRATG